MGFFLQNKWEMMVVRRKVNSLTRKIFYETLNSAEDPLELGNLRKSDEWGVEKNNSLKWVILIDIILDRPIQYIVSFSLDKKIFSCFAATARHNFSNVFQFSTPDYKELEYRLNELAHHIPSLRERMLREYVYNEWKNAPGRKWYNLFSGKSKILDHLSAKIDALFNQKKITKNELNRVQNYITNLL